MQQGIFIAIIAVITFGMWGLTEWSKARDRKRLEQKRREYKANAKPKTNA